MGNKKNLIFSIIVSVLILIFVIVGFIKSGVFVGLLALVLFLYSLWHIYEICCLKKKEDAKKEDVEKMEE